MYLYVSMYIYRSNGREVYVGACLCNNTSTDSKTGPESLPIYDPQVDIRIV